MADQKLTALTEDTAPDPDDIVYGVSDPAGTPVSRKYKVRKVSPWILLTSQTVSSPVATVTATVPTTNLVALRIIITDAQADAATLGFVGWSLSGYSITGGYQFSISSSGYYGAIHEVALGVPAAGLLLLDFIGGDSSNSSINAAAQTASTPSGSETITFDAYDDETPTDITAGKFVVMGLYA